MLNNSYKSNLTFLKKGNSMNKETTKFNSTKEKRSNDQISISYFEENVNHSLSKFRCSGSENDIDAWEDRLCVFSNLCYNVNHQKFYYFILNQTKFRPIYYDSTKGMIYDFKNSNGDFKLLSLSSGGNSPWSPIIVNETYPIKNFTRLHQFHSLMKTYFGDYNIGHGLWEDLGSLSYSMERMNICDENLIIMHLNPIPNTTLFGTYHRYVIPALTKNPMVQFETYVKSFNKNYVCFDNLILGGQLRVFPKDRIKENHGREALFYNWRSKIIKSNGFDPKFVPSRHKIILTNKSNSIWTRPGSKFHRAIVNLDKIEIFLRLTYPRISIEVVEWHKIPFNKQISKLLNTTILITPCGGVSMIIPMLPHGAHAIVMDYYVTHSEHGFNKGQTASMEGSFLNHIHHVKKQYYQIYQRQDYQFDYPGASNVREAASIIVNMTRLQLLIDTALEQMEP
jgi:hypothetical protein